LQPLRGVEIPIEKLEAMRKGIARDLGEGVTLLIKIVDDIPSESNGKFRPYLSRLNHDELVEGHR
jgi:hypothetical protein